MSTSYERGRGAEYRAINELKADGYEAVRTAGSHGKADVIAWNDNLIRFIQCKTWISRLGDYSHDVEALEKMILPPGSQCELWIRQIHRHGWTEKKTIKIKLGNSTFSQEGSEQCAHRTPTADIATEQG